MILDSTTENLYISLSKNVTTNQLHFYCSYNTIGSTSLTPANYYGTTNGTTPTILLPGPSTNQQNQLRYCSIVNVDTKPNSVSIIYSGSSGTANILYVSLFPNESIQYTTNNGWQTYSENGLIKVLGMNKIPNSLQTNGRIMITGTNTTQVYQLVSTGTTYAAYLGVADRNFSKVSIAYRVGNAPTAITWSELAIYRGTAVLNQVSTNLEFCGFADLSSVVNTTGIKTTTITVTGITINDDLYAVFSSSHSGTYTLISGAPDEFGAGLFLTDSNNLRPSTNTTITFTANSLSNIIWCAWQGSQW